MTVGWAPPTTTRPAVLVAAVARWRRLWWAVPTLLALLATDAKADGPDRSPVDLVLTHDEAWLVTANQTSGTVSLVDVKNRQVVDEVSCGRRPEGLALAPDGRRVLVTASYSGTLNVLEISQGKLKPAGSVRLGFEPVGVAVSPDGKLAYVALQANAAVAVVDLDQLRETARIEVGRWPRYLALTPDGSRLAVGTSGDQSISVVDAIERKLLYQESLQGINVGHAQASADGRFVYFPWMVYRQNPIDARNIQAGWVLGSRIARVRTDGPARREAMTLDPRGKAVSDPFGLALTSDEAWLVASAPGTHELLVYRMEGLVFQDHGGPGDHIDPQLLHDRSRFYRVPLGGRPMGLRIARDNRRVFVANYLDNSVQVVDLDERRVTQTIGLGGPADPSPARRGEAIFYDGRRSLDQWYSCHSCHYEGGTNAVAMDTLNDGTVRTFKTVLSLNHVADTAPWTWHGWQTNLESAMRKSLTETMIGPEPTDDDVRALVAFLETLETPPNPYRDETGALSAAAQRGRGVFQSEKAGCANCHRGEFFTDGEVHDVGLGSSRDAYQGYNTPSLLGVFNRVRLLHDGRAKSLEQALTGPHAPAKVTALGELSEPELADLIEYLKSL
ncbi:MAG TPA: cytochrome c peroxidase [Pirellulales bacterium]|nr:cytochrome c peroxidase [Pirellulales bacterium]